jgi:hypothetical protein
MFNVAILDVGIIIIYLLFWQTQKFRGGCQLSRLQVGVVVKVGKNKKI